MRRSKRLDKQSTIMVLAVLISTCGQPVEAARYTDVTGFWGERYVNKLSDQGVIAPADDGKFNPDKPITRAELAVWLVKVLKLENQPVADTPSFPDVKPTDSYYRAVEIIRQNNYVSGYKDGFRPKQ
ncbi:MAG: S-layer homology domain-containing protein, partial [Cyanobacteria bacterium]|nr:S-layer homology domain-containing protein [Cyanobacteriota bacterium]